MRALQAVSRRVPAFGLRRIRRRHRLGVVEPLGAVWQDVPAPGVLRLTIANLARRNALDHEILRSLEQAVRATDAHCIVITGEGSVFCSGYDLRALPPEGLAEAAEALIAHPYHGLFDALEACGRPVIAQINGPAIGGGLELAIGCDLRIAARSAVFGMPPGKLGLVYSHTGIQRFIEVCGVASTKELFLVGKRVDSERAREMGLVNTVVEDGELEAHVLGVARAIAANSRVATAGNKTAIEAVRRAARQLPHELEEQLLALRRQCFRRRDFAEGVRAFFEHRAPVWRDRPALVEAETVAEQQPAPVRLDS